MRRHLLGILALILLAGFVYFQIWPPTMPWQTGVASGCSRGGLLAGVLWIAFREFDQIPPWLVGLLLTAAVVIIIQPRLALLAIPLIIALAILRPRFGRRPKQQQPDKRPPQKGPPQKGPTQKRS